MANNMTTLPTHGGESFAEGPTRATPTRRVNRIFVLLIVVGTVLAGAWIWLMWRVIEHPPDPSTTQRTARMISLNHPAATTARTDEKEIVGWEFGKSRKTTDYIEPFTDTTIISGRQICENPNTTVVIICTSRSSDFFKRAAVRETWGSQKSNSVKVGFILGLAPSTNVQQSIEHESEQYGDIIQENMVDSYMNLSLKSVALLKWYLRWCPIQSILVKADDDTYVDIRFLVLLMGDYQPNKYVVGSLNQRFPTPRDPNGIYYVPKYIYDRDVFPNYVGGPAYFMGRDVAMTLYQTALETPIMHLEDVYITGICAWNAKVALKHFRWASFWEKNKRHNFDRMCMTQHVFCHPIREWEMVALWESRKLKIWPIHINPYKHTKGNASMTAAPNRNSTK